MILRERHFLQAELGELDKMISLIPEANVLDRMSLEDRKKNVEAALSALKPPYYEPARARLTFSGKPVVKSDGILTQFSANILDKFNGMIVTIGASQEMELGARGPIPYSDRYRLMITGATPFGSFGFDLEEAPKDNNMLTTEASPVKAAIDKAKLILTLSAGFNDDELADAIADVNPRAIDAIQAFLEMMVENEAMCVLESDGDSFQFIDVDQIKHAKERLITENIIEGDRELLGTFQGVLPDGREFEFRIKEPEEVIQGKVGPEVEDAKNINRIIGRPAKIKVHTKQVGTSRPRYILNDYEE